MRILAIVGVAFSFLLGANIGGAADTANHICLNTVCLGRSVPLPGGGGAVCILAGLTAKPICISQPNASCTLAGTGEFLDCKGINSDTAETCQVMDAVCTVPNPPQ
jgi:hypothetical protein